MTAKDRKKSGLSPFGNNLLEQLKKKGTEGLELDRMRIAGSGKELLNLSEKGYAVDLDGNIFYHPDTYRGCVTKIINMKECGGSFTLAEAKKLITLTRKFMLPLLNRMERDGYIKRDKEGRTILRDTF